MEADGRPPAFATMPVSALEESLNMSSHVDRSNACKSISLPLLSRSSILILSGILVGMGLRDGLQHELYLLGYFAGAIGIISYFGLELLAQRRQREATKETLQRAASVLNSWLDKESGGDSRPANSSSAIPVAPRQVPC
jgi:hypothetical protein